MSILSENLMKGQLAATISRRPRAAKLDLRVCYGHVFYYGTYGSLYYALPAIL